MTLYRIRDWDKHFENNRSREVKRLSYVILPNSLDGAGYTELIEHKNGAAHYACWVGCVIVASRCDPRGTLLRGSARPHNSDSLSRITRIPEHFWKEALPRLVSLGWLECIDGELKDLGQSAETDDAASQVGATLSQDGAAHTEGNRREGKGTEGSSTEPENLAAVLVYQTVGNGPKTWELTQEFFDQLREAYPGVDVLEQCRKARVWMMANESRRKTAKGMPRYLNNWMDRAQNSSSRNQPTKPAIESAYDLLQKRMAETDAKYAGQ